MKWAPRIIVISTIPLVFFSLIRNQFLFGDVLLTTAIFLVFFSSIFFWLQQYNIIFPRWVGVAGLFGLTLLRLMGDTAVKTISDIPIPLLFFVSAIVASMWVSTAYRNPPGSAYRKRSWIDVGIILVLVFIALIQTLTNLAAFKFQADEYYHIEAATGYLRTGKPVLWNFATEQPRMNDHGQPVLYDRAFVYTWQVAQSLRLFGQPEVAARLPSVVWYVFFLIMAYITVLVWKKDRLFALLVVGSFAFIDDFIFYGRLLRMYSMLLFFGNAAMVFWFLAYAQSLKKRMRGKTAAFIIAAGIFSVVALSTHILFAVFFFSFFLFLALEAVMEWRSEGFSRPAVFHTMLWWVSAGGLCIIGGFVLNKFFFPIIPLASVLAVRSTPNTLYEILPFSDLVFPIVALLLFVGGCFFGFHRDQSQRYTIVLTLSTLFLFVFFIKRYIEIRYILFIVPLMYFIAFDFLYGLLQRITLHQRSEWLRRLTIAVSFVLLVTPLSLPGIHSNVFFMPARADRTHAKGYGHDVQRAYDYIQAQRAPDDAVLILLLRTYYWRGDLYNVVMLPQDKMLTVQQLQAIMQERQHGWLVWSDDKSMHLQQDVRAYIDRHTENIAKKEKELHGSNMHVYYFNLEN